MEFASKPKSRFIEKYGVGKLAMVKFDMRVRPQDIMSLFRDGLHINGQLFSFLGQTFCVRMYRE